MQCIRMCVRAVRVLPFCYLSSGRNIGYKATASATVYGTDGKGFSFNRAITLWYARSTRLEKV
jgi:hypothetical protein